MEINRYVEGYKSNLSLKENEFAIKKIRVYFQTNLAKKLHLIRVTAPLMVISKTGVNDDLSENLLSTSFDTWKG